MQSVIKNAGFTTGLVATMLVCAPAAPSVWAEMRSNVEHAVELTKVDLLNLRGWEQREVAVDGFFLGMTREQAFEVARANNLKLRSDLPPKTTKQVKLPCRETSCSVLQANGNWIGVDLFFNAGHLAKIKISVPVDADPEVKRVNVARKFKGRTYQFFNSYSDDLRKQAFGPAEGKETPVKAGSQTSALTFVEYEYLHSGVIIHLTINKNNHPPRPFDLEVDFVIHQ